MMGFICSLTYYIDKQKRSWIEVVVSFLPLNKNAEGILLGIKAGLNHTEKKLFYLVIHGTGLLG